MKMKLTKKTGIILLLTSFLPGLPAQDVKDSALIRSVFNEAYADYESYQHLEWLCKNTKGRISGRPETAEAIEYTRQLMEGMDLDSVWLQPVMVKTWDRGEPEQARIVSTRFGTADVPSCALGWACGTGDAGLSASVIEVKSLDEWKRMTASEVQGKIVFFNQPMKATNLTTFASYGEAVWQRSRGGGRSLQAGGHWLCYPFHEYRDR
ncbi:MAG: hypothetical protein V2A67_00055 [Bacteroidota bacterium]